MKTIPVEQMSAMPMLLVFEILTALIVFTVGILIVHKKVQDKKKTLWTSAGVGLLAGAAMVAVFIGMSAHVATTNDENLRAAITESGQNLNEEQITALKNQGFVTLEDDKSISFSDEGNGHALTVFDDSENTATQTEVEKKMDQQIKDNDF